MPVEGPVYVSPLFPLVLSPSFRCFLYLWTWNSRNWPCMSHSGLFEPERLTTRRQVERGIAAKGAEVEVIGLGQNFKTTLTGIGILILASN